MKTKLLACASVACALAAAIAISHSDKSQAASPRQPPDCLTRNGTLLLSGKPFFPIGLYQVNHTDAEYALIAANGFNAVQGHFTTNPRQFRETLDLALRHDLAVDVPLYAGNLVRENLAASLTKIRENVTHPAVLSWKILDEPDADQHAHLRGEVLAAYRAIKQLNPPQPVELTLSQDDTLGYWAGFCDLMQIDRYPVPGRPLTQVSSFCRGAMRAKASWQNLTFVVQCGWTPDLKTQPTFDQARAMVYLALVSGAKGISWYSRQETNWDLTTSPLWPRLKEINAEIAALAAPLMLGEDVPGIDCDAPDVRFTGKLYRRKIYLLATNPAARSCVAKFTLHPDSPARAAQLLGAGAPLPFDGATVRIALRGIDSATIVFTL